jgi:hypothetical protein
VLLVLDNFEHLLAAGPHVAELPAACSGPKVLVTGRESLALYGEHEFPLHPLPMPDVRWPTALLARNDAGSLAFDRGDHGLGRELVEESISHFRVFNDHHYLALEPHRAGDLACAAGDVEAAYRSYHESVSLAVESGFNDRVVYALEGFAMLAAGGAQPELALHLAAAAAAARETAGRPRRPAETAPTRAGASHRAG